MAQQSVYDSTLQTIRAQQQARAQQDADAQRAAAAAAAEAERTRSRTAGEFAKDTALSLSAGVGGVLGAGYGLANAATLGTLDRALDGAGTQFFDDFGNAMSEAQSAPLQARKAEISQAFQQGIGVGVGEALSTPSALLDMGVQSLPYFIPGMGIARAAGGVAQAGALARGVSGGAAALAGSQKATQAALVANAAIGGGMMNVDAINAAREAGLSDNEQQLAGLGGFAAGALLSAGSQKLTGSAALEAGVAQRIAGQQVPGVTGSLLSNVGVGIAREGAQETIEEGGQQVIRNVAGQQPWETGVGESAALGGLLGGVFGGVFGAANVRRPTQTRDQIEAMIAQQQAELDAAGLGSGPRPLNDMMKAREQAQQEQARAQAQEQQFQADLAADETVQETLARQQFPEFEEVEDIDVGVIVPPPPTDIEADIDLAAAVPPGLSGLNRIVAEQRAARAGQPPRMGVQEIPFDQFAPAPEGDVAGLPQVDEVTGRSVEDIIRATAPIERVAQQFGMAAAGAEAARRARVTPVEAPQTAIDVSTPAKLGEHRKAVRATLAAKTGMKVSSARGDAFNAVLNEVVESGVATTDPQFDEVVRRATARAVGIARRSGKESDPLGALFNAYPTTDEQRIDDAFDMGGVDTTEEELFGAAPAAPAAAPAPAPAQTGAPLVPVSEVKTGAVGQVWVDGDGNRRVVDQVWKGGKTISVVAEDGKRKVIPFGTARKEGWQLQGTPAVAGLDNESVAQLRELLAGTYWSETGGRLLRAEGDQGEVVGRTSWLSSNPEAQAVLSNTGYKASDVQEWLGRAATGQGQKLGEKQIAIIEGLLGVLTEPQVEVGVQQAPPTLRAVEKDPLVAELEAQRASAIASQTAVENQYPAVRDAAKKYDQYAPSLLADLEGELIDPTDAEAVDRFAASRYERDKTYRANAAAVTQRVARNSLGGTDAADVSEALDVLGTQQGVIGDVGLAGVGGANARVNLNAVPTVANTVEAESPKEVTANAPRYDAQVWADYMTYPGARQLNALVQMKEGEGNPQPVLAAMLYGVDLSGDLTELGQLSSAAQAHPEFNLMAQDARSEVSSHIATAVNRITGATFELAGTVPMRQPSADMQRLLSMSEDEYIAAVNPTGKTSDANDLVIVRLGDLDLPADARREVVTTDRNGVQLDLHVDKAGTIYAVRGTDVVGQIEARDGETLNIVAQEAQGQGVGAALAAELIRRDPFAQAGSFSPAGEAARRAGFRLIKANQAKFSQGTGAKVIPKSLFDKGIAKAEGNYGRPIIGVDTTADLEATTGIPIPLNAKGMFYDGNIYIVRQNIESGKDLAMTVAHEVGHSGLASLLGTSLNAATNRMWANSDMRKRIKAKMATLNMAQGTEADQRASRTLAAEEVLADMLAAGERLNKDIWSKLRAGVREFFARVFGMRDYILTNADVDALLSDVARVTRGAAAGQVASDMANAEMWFSNPQVAATQDPKFSKAQSDLEQMMADAQNEPYTNKMPMGHILKAAVQTGMDNGKRVKSKLREGSTGSFLRTWFMGLDNIVDWNDKLFNQSGSNRGGLLKKFYNLKEAKDAQFNRLNAKKEERTYSTVVNGEERTEKLGSASVNDVIDNWYSFQRTNPAKSDLLDFVMTDGTFYQVFPDRSWDDQVHKGFDYDSRGYTEADRKAAHSRVRAAYNSVGEEGRTLYKKAQSVYAQRFAQYYNSIVKETARIGETAKADAQVRGLDVDAVTQRVEAATKRYKDSLAGIMNKSKSGPYSPLQRYGDHLVTVRDAAGDVVFFAGYQSRAEADAAAAEIEKARAEAGEQVVINIGTPQTTDLDSTGASKQDLAAIRAEVISMLPEGMDPDLYDTASAAIISGLAEVYLQSLPAKSFAKHTLGRKNIAGYDSDALRSFSNYVMRSARTVANIQHDGQIGNAMTEIQQYVKDVGEGKYTDATGVVRTDTQKLQSVANSVKTQHLAAERVEQNKVVNAATAVAFTFQLTSPSHMFMNATQTMFVSFPRLAGKYGGGKANREIMRAMKEYTQSGTDLLSEKVDSDGKPVATLRNSTDPKDAVLLSVLTQIRADGPLDITQAHDAAGIADGSATELSPYAGKVMKWLSIPMHKSEVFNRQIVGAAAVRLELEARLKGGALPANQEARDALVADLVHVGKEAIRTTQFNYSQFNKARSMQSPTGKLLLQYKTYQFNMLSMISKDIRDAELGRLVTGQEPINKEEAAIARSTLAYVLGMQLAFTGAVGTILAPFVFAAMDAWRDDDDLLSAKDEFLVWAAKLGIAGEVLSKGLFAPLMDTARIEAGTLIPILGQGDFAPEGGKPRDTFTYYLTQNLGPATGLARNLFVGTAEVYNGDIEKGVGKLLPKPASDAWKFVFEAPKGVRDAKGIVYFEPNPFDLMMGVAGFRSGDRRDAEAQRSRLYSATTTQFDVRDRYLHRLALAQSAGDRVGISEAMADIQDWNAKYPDLGIKKSDIRGAVRQRVRSEMNAELYGVPSGGLIRPSIAEAAGL
jgi:hypothetical protein